MCFFFLLLKTSFNYFNLKIKFTLKYWHFGGNQRILQFRLEVFITVLTWIFKSTFLGSKTSVLISSWSHLTFIHVNNYLINYQDCTDVHYFFIYFYLMAPTLVKTFMIAWHCIYCILNFDLTPPWGICLIYMFLWQQTNQSYTRINHQYQQPLFTV